MGSMSVVPRLLSFLTLVCAKAPPSPLLCTWLASENSESARLSAVVPSPVLYNFLFLSPFSGSFSFSLPFSFPSLFLEDFDLKSDGNGSDCVMGDEPADLF